MGRQTVQARGVGPQGRRGAAPGQKGWTLAEVLVVLAILSVLLGIALPAVSLVLRVARRTACASNLAQVGLCANLYAEEWGGRYPAESNCGVKDPARSPAWFDRLPTYLEDEKVQSHSVFQCAGFHWSGPKEFTNATPKSFKMNAYLDAAGRSRHYRRGASQRDGEVALFLDAVAGETGMGQWGHCFASAVTDERHAGAVNVLCVDGHTITHVRTPADGTWKDAITWLPPGWEGGP